MKKRLFIPCFAAVLGIAATACHQNGNGTSNESEYVTDSSGMGDSARLDAPDSTARKDTSATPDSTRRTDSPTRP